MWMCCWVCCILMLYMCTFSPTTPSPNIPVDQAYRHLRIVILQKVCKLYKCLLFYIALPPSLNPASFQLRPNLPPAHVGDDDTTPVTSLPCQWKCPKKWKESTLQVSKATFEKHDYAKPAERKIKHVEDFDPRPPEFRGLAANRIPELLNKVRGEQLGISLFLDPNYRQGSVESVQEPSSHSIPTKASQLQLSREAFKLVMIRLKRLREIHVNNNCLLFGSQCVDVVLPVHHLGTFSHERLLLLLTV